MRDLRLANLPANDLHFRSQDESVAGNCKECQVGAAQPAHPRTIIIEPVAIETQLDVTVRVVGTCQRVSDAGLGVRPMGIPFLRHRKMINTFFEGEAPRETMPACDHADLRRHSTEKSISRVLTFARMRIQFGTSGTVASPTRENQRSTAERFRRNMFNCQRTVCQRAFEEDSKLSLPGFVVDLEAEWTRVEIGPRLVGRDTEKDLGAVPCGRPLTEPAAPNVKADRHPHDDTAQGGPEPQAVSTLRYEPGMRSGGRGSRPRKRRRNGGQP